MSFGGSSSKARGDKQSKRTKLDERHDEETKTVRQIERGKKTRRRADYNSGI